MAETLETQTPAPATPQPAAPAASAPAQPAPPAQPRKRGRAMLIVGLIGIVLLVGGFLYYQYSATFESTDDAIIDAHLNNISSRIAGTLTAVNVDENQQVAAGQVLATIDPRDYQVAAEQAKAQLSESQANIAAEHPNVPITETTNESNISTSQAQVDTQLASEAASMITGACVSSP